MEEVTSFTRNYIDYTVQEKTVRLRLYGQGSVSVSRKTVLNCFSDNNVNDVRGLYKAEDPFEWFVVFDSVHSYKHVTDLVEIQLTPSVKATVSAADEVTQIVRFLWVPIYVQNDLFKDYLEGWRLKVVKHEMVYDREDGTYNGTRMFLIKGKKKTIENLPHLLNFHHYGFQSLLIVQGRAPLCLRCRQYGHLRSSCPQARLTPPQQRGYGSGSAASAQQGNRRWETNLQQNAKLKVNEVQTISETSVSESEDESGDSDDEENEGDKTVIENNDVERVDSANENNVSNSVNSLSADTENFAVDSPNSTSDTTENIVAQTSNSSSNVIKNTVAGNSNSVSVTQTHSKEKLSEGKVNTSEKENDRIEANESEKDNDFPVLFNDKGEILGTQVSNVKSKKLRQRKDKTHKN